MRELEYVSALQQTQDDVVRSDGSVQDVDIQLFLKSRYGMLVSLDDIRRTIIESFGDGDGIDLSELASMLLIPTLIKANDQSKQQQEEDGVLYPAPNLVESVLGMILRDVTGSSEPPKLSISLLRDILLAYGEEEMSQDEGLLRDMMNAAGNEGDDFDAEAFSRALTRDVRLYNVKNEATLTTNYHDVMIADGLEENSNKTESVDSSNDRDELKTIESGMNEKHTSKKDAPATFRRFWSSPAIDFTACRYSSKYIVVLLWTGFVISYVAYFGDIIESNTEYYFENLCGSDEFGCRILLSILEWLFILATLAGFGIGYVALCSTGNGIEDTRKWTRGFAVLWMGFFAYFFFFVLYTPTSETVGTITYVDEDGNVLDEEDWILEKTESYQSVVYFIAVIIGSIIILLEFFMMFGDSVRKRCMKSASARMVAFFTSSGIKAEAGSKRAAALKINTLIDNAQQIHSFGAKDIDHGETSFGAGLLNFSVRGEQWEEAGGFLWTWKRLFSKDLFQKEGVWISARLVAGNFSQLLISAFVLTYGIAFTGKAVDEWEQGNADPARYLYLILEWFNVQVTVEEFAESTCNFLADTISTDNTTCTTIAEDAVNNVIQSISTSLYPAERYMVEVPMIIATAVAFVTTLSLVVVYIPSVTSTTLQFRSGVIPFFRDGSSFEMYRSRLDLITILLGSMFWSSLYASALLGILVGFVLFLFLWQVRTERVGSVSGVRATFSHDVSCLLLFQATRTFFVNLLAVLIALICTISIKILISVFLLRKVYVAFYRKKVNQANVVSLALECIMVGFAIGTALARAIKLVLIAVLYIGRIDMPLLAPGVGVGPLMDRYPFIFRQDILALEGKVRESHESLWWFTFAHISLPSPYSTT